MRVEEVVSSFIMCIVSGLVLVGFTIAWYTNNNLPAVTGMSVVAAEIGDIQVALESGGVDISKLDGDAKYADIGMEDFVNVQVTASVDSKSIPILSPGTYGKVTFYLKPTSSSVSACEIVPTVRITQDGYTWYPDVSTGDVSDGDGISGGDSGESDGEVSGDVSGESDGEASGDDGGDSETVSSEDVSSGDAVTIEKLCEIAQGHIVFFADETMTTEISADAPYIETWDLEERQQEKAVDLYWKWYYEYPFTEEQLTGENALSDTEQKEYVRAYDEEDMTLGNNVSGIKFYFTFSAK